MDLVLKSTNGRVTPHAREVAERKAARLARHDPRIQRVEMNINEEPNPRVNGGHRVEASCWSGRARFHATSGGSNLDVAIEQAIARLDRQITGHQGKRRRKLIEGANRVKSGQIAAVEAPPEEEG